jgi:replicative DNA helicase
LTETTIQHQREYELLLCAATLQDAEYVRRECGWLEPDRFKTLNLKTYWTGLLAGDDPITAARKAGPNTFRIVSDKISEASVAFVRDYAQAIDQMAYLAEIAELNTKIAMAISQGNMIAVQDTIAEMGEQHTGGNVYANHAIDGLMAFLETLDNLKDRSVKTGMPPLDAATGGLERQTETILAARPGMGKTALAWQIARNVSVAGQRSLFFSLEMSQRNLWARAACGVLGLRWRDVRDGRASEDEMLRLGKAAGGLMNQYQDRLWINDKPNTTSSVFNEIAKIRPDLVVVDHLRWLRDDPGKNEVVRLGQMSARLKETAKEFDCAIIVVHQLNRGVESRDNKRPSLSDLRESGQLEENADNVIFIYRDDYYNPPDIDTGKSDTDIIIAKARDDVANQRVGLIYDRSKQWFYQKGI